MRTALVVEDDPDQAELAAAFLKLRQLEPTIALNGRTGLELARQEHPDLILLDIMLPDLDGFEVCQSLRADAETMSLCVVMLTAMHADAYRRQGFRVGADAYVTKPYGPEDLFRAIDLVQQKQDFRDQEGVRGEIEIELNSAPEFLRSVNDFLLGLYRASPLNSRQIQQLQQAVLEMGQNAIEWGNRQRLELTVKMTYRLYTDRIEIKIRDQGTGFDLDDLPHAAASKHDPLSHMEVREQLGLREGGFGLLIARGMLDEMRYNDKGNEVTLIKRFLERGASETEGSEG